MLRVSAVEPPRARAGDGDHERALRMAMAESSEPSRLQARIEAQNRIVPHNFSVVVERDFACDHPGCQESFTVSLVPGQIVYPRWCSKHRSSHRRSLPT